jgi:hypothetical protein
VLPRGRWDAAFFLPVRPECSSRRRLKILVSVVLPPQATKICLVKKPTHGWLLCFRYKQFLGCPVYFRAAAFNFPLSPLLDSLRRACSPVDVLAFAHRHACKRVRRASVSAVLEGTSSAICNSCVRDQRMTTPTEIEWVTTRWSGLETAGLADTRAWGGAANPAHIWPLPCSRISWRSLGETPRRTPCRLVEGTRWTGMGWDIQRAVCPEQPRSPNTGLSLREVAGTLVAMIRLICDPERVLGRVELLVVCRC